MNLFTAPRSRPIIYSPKIDRSSILNRNTTRTQQLGAQLKATALRLVTDNIPVIGRIIRARNQYLLPGVQSAKWSYAREVSEQYGLQYYTLLPWYTKAIVVTVTGKYYMGAFAQDTVVSLATRLLAMDQNLLSWIRKELSDLDSKLTNFNLLGAASPGDPQNSSISKEDQDLFSSLTIGTPNDADSTTLLGFIRRFTITESVAEPFVQAYEMEYIGIDQSWYAASTAVTKVKVDN